jgi:hypothetical protein
LQAKLHHQGRKKGGRGAKEGGGVGGGRRGIPWPVIKKSANVAGKKYNAACSFFRSINTRKTICMYENTLYSIHIKIQ